MWGWLCWSMLEIKEILRHQNNWLTPVCDYTHAWFVSISPWLNLVLVSEPFPTLGKSVYSIAPGKLTYPSFWNSTPDSMWKQLAISLYLSDWIVNSGILGIGVVFHRATSLHFLVSDVFPESTAKLWDKTDSGLFVFWYKTPLKSWKKSALVNR